MRVAALICFLLAGVQSFAQPGPGDLFREYIWLPKMAAEQGKFLRVGGRLDYKTNEAHFPADEHRNGYIPLPEDIDLQDDFKATAEEYEGRQHFVIETPEVTCYYDVKGGGFSRIIDDEGNDWVSFKMEPWDEYPGSAAGAFRGLPNLVFGGADGGAGHPGHDKCKSWIEEKKIVTESLSGKWKWSWEFFDDHALLEVLSVDTTRAYWFLYEGSSGGKFDPENTFFGTNVSGPEQLTYNYYNGNIYRDTIRWMYTGHRNVNNTFYMIQCKEDDFPDMISLLGNTENGFDSQDGMTVFGFGRGEGVTRYLTGRNKFIIGLYPKTIKNDADHRELVKFIDEKYLEH